MNFLDHTLPDIAQNYLAELARLSSVRQEAKDDWMAQNQAQMATLSNQVATLQDSLCSTEKNLEALTKKFQMILWAVPEITQKLVEMNEKIDQNKSKISIYGYVENGNGTITDKKTGLMWKQKREVGDYTWKTAMQRFNNKDDCPEFGGYSDWRLPKIEELETLILIDRDPKICEETFPSSREAFWSSSPFAEYPEYAWVVNFLNGSVGYVAQSHGLSVRLVRRSQ